MARRCARWTPPWPTPASSMPIRCGAGVAAALAALAEEPPRKPAPGFAEHQYRGQPAPDADAGGQTLRLQCSTRANTFFLMDIALERVVPAVGLPLGLTRAGRHRSVRAATRATPNACRSSAAWTCCSLETNDLRHKFRAQRSGTRRSRPAGGRPGAHGRVPGSRIAQRIRQPMRSMARREPPASRAPDQTLGELQRIGAEPRSACRPAWSSATPR